MLQMAAMDSGRIWEWLQRERGSRDREASERERVEERYGTAVQMVD